MDDQFTGEIKAKMAKALDVTKNDLANVRTGRATGALVENVEITTYGGSTKLKIKELSTVTTPDAKTLVVHPFDPSTHDDIIKGIQTANVGLSPVSEGDVIRISIPPLSEERRQEYLRLAKAKLEAGKVMIRQIRQEEMVNLRRDLDANTITEDDRKRGEKIIQELTNEAIAELEHLGEMKEKELLQI